MIIWICLILILLSQVAEEMQSLSQMILHVNEVSLRRLVTALGLGGTGSKEFSIVAETIDKMEMTIHKVTHKTIVYWKFR